MSDVVVGWRPATDGVEVRGREWTYGGQRAGAGQARRAAGIAAICASNPDPSEHYAVAGEPMRRGRQPCRPSDLSHGRRQVGRRHRPRGDARRSSRRLRTASRRSPRSPTPTSAGPRCWTSPTPASQGKRTGPRRYRAAQRAAAQIIPVAARYPAPAPRPLRSSATASQDASVGRNSRRQRGRRGQRLAGTPYVWAAESGGPSSGGSTAPD